MVQDMAIEGCFSQSIIKGLILVDADSYQLDLVGRYTYAPHHILKGEECRNLEGKQSFALLPSSDSAACTSVPL